MDMFHMVLELAGEIMLTLPLTPRLGKFWGGNLLQIRNLKKH